MPLGGSKVADASAASSSKRRSHRPRKLSASATPAVSPASFRMIQTMHDISRDVFAAATTGFVPSPNDVARLSGFLNGVTLQDLGLDATMPYFRADSQGRPRVTYLHFANSRTLSFGVFCLPQSAVIPLHDHPGMTVFSKILLGSMQIKSYDWVKAPISGNQALRAPSGARLAKLDTDAVFDASSETVVLYPEAGGNLHCFTAMTPCAVLDVMGPPYCHDEGRDCSYYRGKDMPGGDGQYIWLKEVPCNFKMETVHMRPGLQG